jgi:type I restriction enzyme S subunit
VKTFGDLTAPKVEQSGPGADGEFVYVDISSIDNQAKRIVEPKRLASDAAPSRARQCLRAGDVLVSMTRPNLNAVAIVPTELDGAIGSTGFHVLRATEGVDQRWLFYAVQSFAFVKAMCDVVQGALYPAVRPKDIRDYALEPPSLHRQREIVAEIDKQFSRLDEAVANLQRVKANLKRYKAAVLKAAVEGRLVETEASIARREGRGYETGEQLLRRVLVDRKTNWAGKGKYVEPAMPDLGSLPALPEGWIWATAEAVCAPVVDCHNKTAPYVNSGIPLVRTTNIRDGQLLMEGMRFVDQSTYEFWSRRCPPAPGDVLFTREAPMGEACIVPAGMTVCLGQRTMLMRPSPAITASFLLAALMSPVIADLIDRVAVGSGVKHLRVGDVERLPIPLPPMAEQLRIVAELDRLLSVQKTVEAEVDANLQRAQSLRQSVLQFAFSESRQFGDGISMVAGVTRSNEPASVVVAARVIAQLCDVPTFGRVKLQKLLFLSTHHARIDASNDEYVRMQAGPLDMYMLQGVLKRLDQLRWFREKSREQGRRSENSGYTYERLSLVDDYKAHLGVITGNQLKAVDHICLALRTWSTEDCELLATVYAVWNDLLLWRHPVSDDAIVEQVHEHWNESKRRFSLTRIVDMKSKLTDLGLEPTGFGRPTVGAVADSHSRELF